MSLPSYILQLWRKGIFICIIIFSEKNVCEMETSTVCVDYFPDSKVHGTNMGPTWVLSAPDGPHIGPMNLAIWVFTKVRKTCLQGVFSRGTLWGARGWVASAGLTSDVWNGGKTTVTGRFSSWLDANWGQAVTNNFGQVLLYHISSFDQNECTCNTCHQAHSPNWEIVFAQIKK